MSNEIALPQQPTHSMQSYCFANAQAFEAAQRMATALSKATLVPKEYQNNVANCIIALEVAHRMNASPTMVMQNLYIVHGRPSWSSQFIIAALTSCGRFTPPQFHLDGAGDDWGCYVTAKDKDGQILKGPRVNIEMAKKEGWYSKTGSKWQTMPEMMLRYRAASFFGKLYAPDVLMGMYTQEENEDIGTVKDVTPHNTDLKDAFMNNNIPRAAEDLAAIQETYEATNATLDILLSPTQAASQPKGEVASVAQLVMTGGEVKGFPNEINTSQLMTALQDMMPYDEKIFILNNTNAFPKIIEFMKSDGKPKAAESLEKIINKK